MSLREGNHTSSVASDPSDSRPASKHVTLSLSAASEPKSTNQSHLALCCARGTSCSQHLAQLLGCLQLFTPCQYLVTCTFQLRFLTSLLGPPASRSKRTRTGQLCVTGGRIWFSSREPSASVWSWGLCRFWSLIDCTNGATTTVELLSSEKLHR
jgi:hypothetical protein